jgi:nucleotide-binding universal stress UspA family protein
MNLQKILVPFDLREDSYSALNHAAFFANHSAGEIVILHIIKNAQDKAEAEKKLKELGESLDKKY